MNLSNISAEQADSITIEINIERNYNEVLDSVLENGLAIKELTILIRENQARYDVFKTHHGVPNYEQPDVYLAHRLVSLPEKIGTLENLETLNISSLGLTSLPKGLVKLKKLRFLDISYNDLVIETEVEKICQLDKLEVLNLHNCVISKEVLDKIKEVKPSLRINFGHDYSENEKEEANDYLYYREMPDSLVVSLLKAIHKYYPIGSPLMSDLYPGYKILREELEGKIRTIQTKGKIEPWDKLINVLEENTENNRIINLSAQQFPNYTLLIEIDNTSSNGIQIKKYAHLTVSLLVNYFTIFFESRVTFDEYLYNGRPVMKTILHGIGSANKFEQNLAKLLKASLINDFNNYSFVKHNILFRNKVRGGLPFGEGGESYESEYSIYRYLFGLIDDTDVVIAD